MGANRLLKNPLTTGEIKACVDDLKVLGKKDFKMLLKYRTDIREDVSFLLPAWIPACRPSSY